MEEYIKAIKAQMTRLYGACALHAGYLTLQTHPQNMKYLLLFPQQLWLHGHGPILRYTYILVLFGELHETQKKNQWNRVEGC